MYVHVTVNLLHIKRNMGKKDRFWMNVIFIFKMSLHYIKIQGKCNCYNDAIKYYQEWMCTSKYVCEAIYLLIIMCPIYLIITVS